LSAIVLPGNVTNNSLNFENILHSGYVSNEGRIFIPGTEDFGIDFIRCLAKSPMFSRIWEGGPRGLHLRLRKQVDEKDGHLIYNGKPYNRDTWGCYYVGDCQFYGPPLVIRQMGRMAKEIPDDLNTHPEISIQTQKGDTLRLDACPCGGDLRKDRRGALYCSECFMIYE
jgi:hypothetical protein